MSLEIAKERLRVWGKNNANSTYAKVLLFLVSFSEASFFPIPPDVLLIAMLLAGTKRWIYLSFLTTLGSVLGGIVGYAIGYWLYDSFGQALIETYNLTDELNIIKNWFDKYAFLTVFLSGFTILPYKIFTIASGLFNINFLIFIIASIVSRGARFFLEGLIMRLFGENIGKFLYRYFNIASIVLIILVVVVFIAFSL